MIKYLLGGAVVLFVASNVAVIWSTVWPSTVIPVSLNEMKDAFETCQPKGGLKHIYSERKGGTSRYVATCENGATVIQTLNPASPSISNI